MSSEWLYPTAPALLLLSGAFILTLVKRFPQRDVNRQAQIIHRVALTATVLVFVTLAVRIALQKNSSFFDPPVVLVPWGTGEGLTVRLDAMGAAFMFIPILLLLALFLGRQVKMPGWLLSIAGITGLVVIAANGISISYALLLFDAVGGWFWARQNHPNLALARLLLAVITATVLVWAGLAPTAPTGATLLAFALWLRLGLFPLIEVSIWKNTPQAAGETMVWLTLSSVVGVYAAARFLVITPHPILQWLMALTVLLSAWLSWLSDPDEADGHLKLLRMVLVQPGLVLLMIPLTAQAAITLGLGYALSLGTLWLTPRVGKPNLLERHWIWIYAAPVLASLTIVGIPLTFGWVTQQTLFARLLQQQYHTLLMVILLTEGLAFSGLYLYWQSLLKGHDKQETALWTALLLTIPFLLPGVAGITFSVITGLTFLPVAATPITNSDNTGIAGLIIIWLMALATGAGRQKSVTWLGLNPVTLETNLSLNWLWPRTEHITRQLNRNILYFKAIFEGTHYLAWALLMALAGILVLILS